VNGAIMSQLLRAASCTGTGGHLTALDRAEAAGPVIDEFLDR